jgi:riboflavin kinase / FMN adenylyltransferase
MTHGPGNIPLPLRVRGRVVHGEGRGRKLGFPTANVRPDPGHPCPPFGIYAGCVNGYLSAISVGVRPTFGSGLEPLIEAHLLDFDGDLYGRAITIELRHWLRAELNFDSLDELRLQIADDIVGVREALTVIGDDPASRTG